MHIKLAFVTTALATLTVAIPLPPDIVSEISLIVGALGVVSDVVQNIDILDIGPALPAEVFRRQLAELPIILKLPHTMPLSSPPLVLRRQGAPTDTCTGSPTTIPVCCDNSPVPCSLLAPDDVCDAPNQALCCEFEAASSSFQCFAAANTTSDHDD
ncbi:hypothetical protein BDP27DRAFT_1419447 [Rhodocollybia butyracea]|uniref:Hydrophobin n=1 Tax=Rhodocollybia butyracea TaxID=206335 RepID=A0A9P5UAC5_9AGAR|nr:hypothetical protein BDP27DRAFT_1419447 [Rhodocollybia butyracea]